MATTEFTPGEIKVLIQAYLQVSETRLRSGQPAAEAIESAARLARQIETPRKTDKPKQQRRSVTTHEPLTGKVSASE